MLKNTAPNYLKENEFVVLLVLWNFTDEPKQINGQFNNKNS